MGRDLSRASADDRNIMRRFAGQLFVDWRTARQRNKAPVDDRPVAGIIFGAGALPGIGAAVAMRSALNGLPIYLAGRNEDKIKASVAAIEAAGGNAAGLVTDVRKKSDIRAAFERVDVDGYAVDFVVHNAGTNRPAKFLDIKPEHLEKSWEADCLSGFLVAQAALDRMLPRQRGTLLFTGASASLRGKAGFGGFAASKAGLRMLAQALAREFGPKGIHVAHIIVDGMVDGQRLRDLIPELLSQQGESGSLNPEAIAENYWDLYQQHRSAWTHELDLRPATEQW